MQLHIKTFLIILFFTSCKNTNEPNNSHPTIKRSALVKEVLVKQLDAGAPSDYSELEYQEKDLEVSIEILRETLKENNFKVLTNNEFTAKVKNVFGRVIDTLSAKKNLQINFINPCDKSLFFQESGVDYFGLYVVKKERFFTSLYPLPYIIDYQKEFPELSHLEDNEIKIKDEIEGTDITVTRWREIPDLDSIRNRNLQIVVARNKYLLNDDTSHLPWLVSNDSEFMKALVTKFGYTVDKALLLWAINNNRFEQTSRNNSNGEDFGRILYSKNCLGKFILHKEVFEVVYTEAIAGKKETILNLIEYLDFLNISEEDSGLSFEEEAAISAHIIYIFQKLINEKHLDFSSKGMGFFAENRDSQGEFEKEFRKNNFYNLSGFKGMWEESKIDGDGIAYPGEE